jgi:hypothetical protein
MLFKSDGSVDSYSDNEAETASTAFESRQSSLGLEELSSSSWTLEEISSPDLFRLQCTEIDSLTYRVAEERNIKEIPNNFCVTVRDPQSEDIPLIAVSDKYEAMTGYPRCELLGNSGRFLTEWCTNDVEDLMKLKLACQTGSSFTGMLTNQRKSGEHFLDLLHLRGLTVARNQRTGEHVWFLIGIHVDMTQAGLLGSSQIHHVVSTIRSKMTEDFSRMAVSGALLSSVGFQGAPPEEWQLLPTPTWI